MTTLADVTKRVEAIAAHFRNGARGHRPRRTYRCGFCLKDGHNVRRCPLLALGLWTNDREIYAATSAADAAQLEREADATFADEAVPPTPPGAWRRIEDDAVVALIVGDVELWWTASRWARSHGRGLLALDDKRARGVATDRRYDTGAP